MDNSDANLSIDTVDDSDCPISPSGKIGQTAVSQNSRSKSGKTAPKNPADIPSTSRQKRDSSSLVSDSGKKKKTKTKHGDRLCISSGGLPTKSGCITFPKKF